MDLPWWLSIFYLFVFPFISTHGYSRLTDMKCKALNRTKFDILHCSLTNLGHGNVSANVHLNVHQPPDKNWMVSYGIWRDQGGYKPFFHNISLDFCRFLKNPSRLQLYYSFHKAILPFSNLNHSCPYTHDIIVKDLLLEDKMFSLIPIPKGSYMFNLRLGSNSVWALDLQFYVDLDVRKSLRKRKPG